MHKPTEISNNGGNVKSNGKRARLSDRIAVLITLIIIIVITKLANRVAKPNTSATPAKKITYTTVISHISGKTR